MASPLSDLNSGICASVCELACGLMTLLCRASLGLPPEIVAAIDQKHGHFHIAAADIDFGAAPRRMAPAGRRHRHGRDYHGAVHFLGEALQPCGNISGLTEKLQRRPIGRPERTEDGGTAVDADAEAQRRLDVACEIGTDL